MTTSMEFIVSNLAGHLRWEMLEGRRHLVGPVVMGGEGVLNGSEGPFFYPGDEWKSTIDQWNGRPIIVNHSELQGKGISAADPVVFNQQKVGVVFRAVWNGKARAEAWIDEEKANKVDPRIIKTMLANQMMEVSTGLKVDPEFTAGDYMGTTYIAVARNHKPDHLALLPDDVGAYSIADGGGLLQLNKESGVTADDIGLNLRKLIDNALSHEDLRKRLKQQLRERFADLRLYIQAVYDDRMIYEIEPDEGPSQLFLVDYTRSGDQVTLGLSPVEVVSKTIYQSVDGTTVINQEGKEETVSKEEQFDKEKFVTALIANEKTAWEEGDREALQGLPDEALQKLEPIEPKPETKPDRRQVGNAESETSPAPASGDTKPVKLDELIANASAEDRDLFQEMRSSHQREKGELVQAVVANKENDFSQEELESMPMRQLRGLARLAKSSVPEESGDEREFTIVGNYQGQLAGNLAAGQTYEQEPLGIPSWDDE